MRHRKERIAASVLYAKENSELCNSIKRRSKLRCRAKQFTTQKGKNATLHLATLRQNMARRYQAR